MCRHIPAVLTSNSAAAPTAPCASTPGWLTESWWCAVADVVKDVCSSSWTGGTDIAVDRMTGFAKAWAQARRLRCMPIPFTGLGRCPCTAPAVTMPACTELGGHPTANYVDSRLAVHKLFLVAPDRDSLKTAGIEHISIKHLHVEN